MDLIPRQESGDADKSHSEAEQDIKHLKSFC